MKANAVVCFFLALCSQRVQILCGVGVSHHVSRVWTLVALKHNVGMGPRPFVSSPGNSSTRHMVCSLLGAPTGCPSQFEKRGMPTMEGESGMKPPFPYRLASVSAKFPLVWAIVVCQELAKNASKARPLNGTAALHTCIRGPDTR